MKNVKCPKLGFKLYLAKKNPFVSTRELGHSVQCITNIKIYNAPRRFRWLLVGARLDNDFDFSSRSEGVTGRRPVVRFECIWRAENRVSCNV